jgi:hypothetical protein
MRKQSSGDDIAVTMIRFVGGRDFSATTAARAGGRRQARVHSVDGGRRVQLMVLTAPTGTSPAMIFSTCRTVSSDWLSSVSFVDVFNL